MLQRFQDSLKINRLPTWNFVQFALRMRRWCLIRLAYIVVFQVWWSQLQFSFRLFVIGNIPDVLFPTTTPDVPGALTHAARCDWVIGVCLQGQCKHQHLTSPTLFCQTTRADLLPNTETPPTIFNSFTKLSNSDTLFRNSQFCFCMSLRSDFSRSAISFATTCLRSSAWVARSSKRRAWSVCERSV